MDREAPPHAPKPPKPPQGNPRDERLKAALKANMGRRKLQARERAAEGGSTAPAADDTVFDGTTCEDTANEDTTNEDATNENTADDDTGNNDKNQ